MLRRSFMIASLSLVALVAVAFTAQRSVAADTESLQGKPAPDWTLKTMDDGKDVKLSSLKGEVVFVDYWATWCPPCRESLPHVNALANDADLKAKGLKVFAINSKESTEKAAKYVKDNKLTFTVLMDPQGMFGKEYLVEGIPTSVVIGRDGTIKKVFVGFGEGSEKQLKAAIEEALKEAAPAKNT